MPRRAGQATLDPFPSSLAPLVTCGFDYGYSLKLAEQGAQQAVLPGPSFWLRLQNPCPCHGLSFVLANAKHMRGCKQTRTNQGELGQMGVIEAALCPFCHRAVLLAGSCQGKEVPSPGSAAPWSPLLLTQQPRSEEPPKGMALRVWCRPWPAYLSHLPLVLLPGVSQVGGDPPDSL